MNLTAFKDILFARGAQMGFTEMELYYQSDNKFRAGVFKGEVDSYTISVEGGVAFRGVIGGKMGNAYTEKIDESSVAFLLEGASASAGISDSDEVAPVCDGTGEYQVLDLYSQELADSTPEAKIALLKSLEAEAYRLDARVATVTHCVLVAQEGERYIANTRGLSRSDKSNAVGTYVGVMVREGDDTKTAYRFKLTRGLSGLAPEAMAAEAVHEAVSYLGAEPVESRTYPVLFRGSAAADLLGTFAPMFSALDVQKGRSLLKDKLGQQVAGANITIVDDPFLPEGAASRSFDSEGVAARKITMVEQGVLKSYLHNLKTAQKDGVPSTGHGYKPSYKGAVGIAPSNMYIQPGLQSFAELVESLTEGIVITEVSGLHSGANVISGDFSLASNGYYVNDGKVVRPVNQITVAGNFLQMLTQIEAVGSDLAFEYGAGGYIGSPTLKVAGLAVAGK